MEKIIRLLKMLKILKIIYTMSSHLMKKFKLFKVIPRRLRKKATQRSRNATKYKLRISSK
jgi:hypothetical protein